jgi:hypothetical protein
MLTGSQEKRRVYEKATAKETERKTKRRLLNSKSKKMLFKL